MRFPKKPKLLLACLLTAALGEVQAVTKYWVGANTDWNYSSNWSPAGVPTASDDAVFNSSNQFDCVLTSNVVLTGITIGSAHTGGFDFGSYTMVITTSDADLRSGGAITAGAGSLVLNGSSVQILLPKTGATHPRIIHDGAGILRIDGANLIAMGFSQIRGDLDLNGFDITTVSGGDFSIHNGGASSLSNLGGRTLTVAGKSTFLGTPAANLGLNPGTGWTLASTGSVYVDRATVGNCNAGTSQGAAFRSTNGGGNTNWAFATDGTYFWNRNDVIAGGVFNRAFNWASGADGSGFRPASSTDDEFTTDALGGSWTFVDADTYTGGSNSLTTRADQLQLIGRGQDMSASYSQFVGVHRGDITGDFDVTVKLLFQTPTLSSAQAGILIADDPTSLTLGGFCALSLSPAGNLVFRRDEDGDGNLEAATTVSSVTGPVWLRMVKNGTAFSAFYRATLAGAAWTQVGSAATISSTAANSVIGLFSTAGTNSEDAEAVFDDFQSGGDYSGSPDFSFNGTGANADAASNLAVNASVGSIDFTGYTGNFGFGSLILNVTTGNATFVAGQTLTAGSGTLVFSAPAGTQTFTPKSGATFPGISKSGAGTVVVASNQLVSNGFSISAGTWNWGSSSFIHNVTSITATGGTMTFGDAVVRVTGGADLSGLGTLNANTGYLEFTGGSAQSFIPKSGATHPNILVSGSGTITLTTNSLTTSGMLSITAGTFALGSLAVTTGGNVSVNGGTLSAASGDLVVGGNFTVLTGTATCPGAGRTFSVAGDFTHSSPATLNASSTTVTFNGTASGKSLDAFGTLGNLTVNGTGGAWTVANNSLTVSGTLALTAGSLNISTNALTLTAVDLTLNGGTLTAGNGNIDVNGNLTMSSGTLTAPVSGKTFAVSGNFAQSGGTLTAGTGTITLDATSTRSFQAASTLNIVTFNGSGAVWTAVTSGLTTGTLNLSAGSLNLGSGLTHTLATPNFTGGTLEFGSSTLRVSGSAVDMSGLGTLAANTGYLEFTNTAAATFTPKSGAIHPNILQSGSGTTTVATNNLIAQHLQATAGTFDVSANSLNLTLSDDLTVSGGTVTLTNSNVTATGGLAVTSGTLNCPGSGKNFIFGDGITYAAGATLNHNSGTLTLNGTATGQSINASGTGLFNVTISGAGSTWTTAANLAISGLFYLPAGTVNLSTNGFDLTCGGLSIAGGTLTAGSANIDVNGDLTMTSGTLTCPGSSKTFTIRDNITHGGGTITPNGGSVTLDGTSPGSVLNVSGSLGNLTVNGSGSSWTLVTNHLTTVGNVTLTAGTLNIHDNSLNLNVTGNLTINGGTLTAGNGNVDVNGSFSMTSGTYTAPGSAKTFLVRDSYAQTGGTFNANGGALIFDGTGTGNTFNGAGTLNRVDFESAGEWTVSGNGISTDVLSMMSGTLRLGTGLTHVVTGSTDITGGVLDFGSSTLRMAGATVDLSSLTTLTPGTGTLEFNRSSAQTFVPKNGSTHPAIKQTGSGTTTLSTYNLTSGNADINAGGFDIGIRTWTISGNLVVAGGTLTATNGTVDVNGNLTLSSGTLTCPTGTLSVTGNITKTAGGTLTHNSGMVLLDGTATGKTLDIASGSLNTLTVNGSGGAWSVANNGLNLASSLTMTVGTLNLGTSLTHTIANLSAGGGTLDFGSSTLVLTSGHANFSSLGTLTAGTGTLEISSSGSQDVSPKIGATHPHIRKTGSGTSNMGDMTLGNLEVAAGSVVASGTLTLNGNLLVTGGTMDAQVASLDVNGNVSVSASQILKFPAGGGGRFFNVSGNFTATPTSSLWNNSGTLTLDGTSTGNALDIGPSIYNLVVNGSGGEWTATNRGISMDGNLTLTAGTLKLGSYVSLTDNVASTGGSLDFGSGTLRVWGQGNFSGLATLASGTGTLNFYGSTGTQIFTPKSGATFPAITHTTGTTLRLDSYSLTCASFNQSAGTLDFNGLDLTTVNSGDFTINSGTSTSIAGLAGRTLTVAGNASFNGAASTSRLNLNPGIGWTAAVTGVLTASLASLDYSNATASAGTCSNCANGGNNTSWNFGVSWDGGGGDASWSTAANWASDFVPTTLDAVTFSSTATNATLDAAASVKSITFTTGYTGAFSFSSNTLTINSGNADFRSGGAITAGTGNLVFTSATAQTFIPKSGATFPALELNGTGGVTLSTNNLSAGNLTLTTGNLTLGTGMTHAVANIVPGAGAGIIFGSSTLQASGTSVSFAGLGTLSSVAGTLEFTGTSAQTFTGKSGVSHPGIKQNGTGGTTLATNDWNPRSLTITSGTFNLGSGRTIVVTTTFSATGGGLDFGSSILEIKGGSTDFSSLASVTAGTGTLRFSSGLVQTFIPKAGAIHPNIQQSGSGGTTVSTNNLAAGSLTLNQGTFNLGTGLIHTFASVSDGGGGPYGDLHFNSSQLHVTGNVQLGNTPTLTVSAGSLYFDGASGTQVFVPKSGGAAHPPIYHPGAGTLQLATNDLTCNGFTQGAGTLDLNSRNITTVASTDFSITNGSSSSFSGLAGRTLTVSGNASFAGASSASRLNLNPASAWTLVVSGTLTGSLASVKNSSASGSTGSCTNCANEGSNTGWTFDVAWDGGGSDANWSTAGNWASDFVPAADDQVTFNATSNNATLDAAASIKSITFTSGYTGAFSFSSNTLTINSGNADFRSGGAITAGTGSLAFTSTASQVFHPKSGATFPNIVQNGSGSGNTTVTTNALSAGNLTITAGTLHLGSGFSHTVAALSGSGTLHFGVSNLNVTGDADLSGLTVTVPTTNVLTFTGASAQTFTPNASVTGLLLTQNGAGGTTVSTSNFTTPSLAIASGTFNLGTGRTHIVTDLSITGGGLAFGSSILKVSGATVNLASLSVLTPGTGTLEFTGGSLQTFTPKASATHPGIKQNGSGGTTIATNSLTAGDLYIHAGTLNLGAGFSHAVTYLGTFGGGLDFSSSQLAVNPGSADFSGLSTLTPGTGTLAFTSTSSSPIIYPKASATLPSILHAGGSGGTLILGVNAALSCLGYTQTGGTLNFNGQNFTTVSGGNFTVTNGTTSSFSGLGGRTLTVAGNASFTGQAGNPINLNPASAWNLAVTGTLSASLAQIMNCNASASAGSASGSGDGGGNTNWNFSLAWDGGGTGNNWNTSGNWSGDVVPGATTNVVFDATSTKNADLDGAATVKSIAFTSGYTGTFSFGTNTLNILGNADFRSGGPFAAGSGTLSFNGSAAQTFIPKASETFPGVVQNGSGGTTVATNGMKIGSLTLSVGTFNLGSGLTHEAASIGGSGGSLNFGGSTLKATGNVNLGGLSGVTAGTGRLEFSGSSAQAFTPANGMTHPRIAQTGTGSTSVQTYNLITSSLRIEAGTLALGAGLVVTVTDTLLGSGGTLDFGSSTLKNGTTASSFTGLAAIVPATGTLEFNSASAQTFSPKSGAAHPAILQSGAGGTTIVTNPLSAGDLTLSNGTFSLGDNGFSHTFANVSASGGALSFSNSTLETAGNVNLGSLGTLTAGTGTLVFKAASGTQTFTPKNGAVHPMVLHATGSLLALSTNALNCLGFTQTAGSLDLGGVNLTISGSGNLNVSGATAPIANLGGRTLTVAGNALFAGTWTNRMDLDPASAWTLAVTGTLKAANVRLRNNLASVSAGVADSSVNLGGNGGWTFLDTIKPENISAFTASALTGNTVSLAWSASTSTDADSVMLRYRTDGTYPASRTDGVLLRSVAAARTADTATGLSDKTVYHFAAFVKDSANNFSPGLAAARDTARTPDITPPANVSALLATGIGPGSVSLAWTSPVTPDADSIMIRYAVGLTHPASPTDGTLWKKLPVARTADTLTGLTTNTLYAVGLFVRDSSGNFSPAAAGARDTALYQLPVTGSVAVNDLSGRTRDGDPALAFTWSGADSLRFGLPADTAAAAWKSVRTLDSTAVGAADGYKILAVQFKNIYGKRSLWYADTTLVDRKAPVVALDLQATHGRWTWPASVSGLSKDSLTGTDRVLVIRRRLSDGAHFNGTAWLIAPDTAKLVLSGNDSAFSTPMPASAMTTGDYQVVAYATDRAGNSSAPITRNVAYTDNRVPALAYGNASDTILQNQAVNWTLDIGDMDVGDSLIPVSLDVPAWLTATPGPDTAWAPWALHKTYKLNGRPLQAHVGANSIQVRVQDRGGLIFTYAKTVFVVDVNDAPVFADSQSTLSVKEDSATRWTPRFKDEDGDDKHVLALLAGPAFARLDSLSVVFQPGSRDVGIFPLRLTVGDGILLDTLETTLTVVNVNDPPYAFASTGWESPAFWKEDRPDSFTVVVVDMDRNEPVILATQLPGFIKMAMTLDSTGYNRSFRFKVNPTGKDTGSVSLALTFLDINNAETRLALVGRVLAHNDTPTAVIEEQRVHAGAARFRLAVTDEDGGLDYARFHYRLVGPAGDTLRRGITPANLLALHPLAEGNYRLAVMAEDQGGIKQPAFTVSDFSVTSGSSLAVDSARWHMLGAPLAMLSATAFGAGATLAAWDETGDDGQPLARYASGKSVEAMKRGKGYWVRIPKSVALTAGQKDLLEGPFTFKLTHAKQGWNQVANPYPYWVDLSASKLTFWEWDAQKRDLVNSHGLLKPWAAYWVLAPRDTVLILADAPYFPPMAGPLAKAGGAGAFPEAAGVGFHHREDWSVQLALRAGSYHDQANLLGVRAMPGAPGIPPDPGLGASTTGVMAASMPDAPKFGDYIALHFEKAADKAGGAAAQGYATDFRDRLDPEEEWWDFSVENAGSGEKNAQLTPAGLEALASAGLRLFLVRQNEARLVEPGEGVTLDMQQEKSHYSLVVTPHADFASRLKGNFSISQNFPNPVTSFTAFRFFLPQSWDKDGKRMARDFKLRINVYDYSGRQVAQAAKGSFRPGSHTLLWRPVSGGGAPLAKGAYVYRLETPGFVKSLKMVVE